MSKELNRTAERALSARSVWCVGVAALAAGCGSSPPVKWRDPGALPLPGNDVTLYYDPGTMPCAGTLPFLDASAATIAQYLGVPPGDPIPYYYTQYLLPCPPNSRGCTVGPPAASLSCWGKEPDLVHELVHAQRWRKTGMSNSFLEEGLAVALGQLDVVGIANSGASDQELLTPAQLPTEDFGLAGDFVSYLLTRFGPASFVSLLQSVHATDSVDAIESAFAGVYGESMTALRADRSHSTLSFYSNRLDLPECQALAPDPTVGQGTPITETVDCTTNAVGVPGMNRTHIPFDVAADGLYVLTVQLDTASGFGLYACVGGTGVHGSDLGPNPLVVGYLHAGRYFFDLQSNSAVPQTISVSLAPVILGAWPACAAVPPVTVPSGTEYVYLFSMDDGALEVPFTLEDAATLVGLNGVVSQTLNQLQLCTAGCGASCRPDGVINPPQLAAGATFTLQATFAGQPKLVGENLQSL
jgi:hypothetical protein